jgi:hypothetical protein
MSLTGIALLMLGVVPKHAQSARESLDSVAVVQTASCPRRTCLQKRRVLRRSSQKPLELDTVLSHANAIGFLSLPADIRADTALCGHRDSDRMLSVTLYWASRSKEVVYWAGCKPSSPDAVARFAALRQFEKAVLARTGLALP